MKNLREIYPNLTRHQKAYILIGPRHRGWSFADVCEHIRESAGEDIDPASIREYLEDNNVFLEDSAARRKRRPPRRRPAANHNIPGQSTAGSYTARVCFNSKGWRFPTGEAAQLESGSYVAENGFGGEEWLFNFGWLIDGFHYAFLQPVSKSFEKLAGKTIDVLLYTINPSGDRLYGGEISHCEVLRREQAEHAFNIYKERGWLKSMKEQVAPFSKTGQAILKPTEARNLFNVRFRPDNADIYDPPRIAGHKDAVWKHFRYNLGWVNEQIEAQWRKRKGTTTPPSINTVTRKGTPAVTYDPIHKRLQADLFSRLQHQYGKGRVTLENDYVDITVEDGDRTTLIEIKSASTCRAAVRESLGQLLEYAYYRSQPRSETLDLIIVAPGKLDKLMEAYIQRLRADFNMPIWYLSYSEGDPLPAVFVKR
jgi:hypothetical protein